MLNQEPEIASFNSVEEECQEVVHISSSAPEEDSLQDQKEEERTSGAHEESDPTVPDSPKVPCPYELTDRGIIWHKQTRHGKVTVSLTNFPAQIVGDVVEDDGVERQRSLELEATVEGATSRFTIPASEFHSMNWPTQHLGPKAIVYAGYGGRDQTRVAMQSLSTAIDSKTIYTHTGWRKMSDGTMVYLHAGGAIGTGGTVSHIGVNIGGALAKAILPEPLQGPELQAAVKASLGFIEVAPKDITVPIYAGIWRSVLGDVPFSLYVSGHTGTMKSTLSALAQQHFGKDMDASNLPGSWSSTANALEGLCFTAKDLLFTIDDFCPLGSLTDQQRLHAQADRVFRGQGNHAGRQRMRSDGSLRPPKPPRGLILATGEDIPRGQSLQARLIILEMSPGMVNLDHLTSCQDQAGKGVYAQAMAGYLQWVARHYDRLKKTLSQKVSETRGRLFKDHQHKRTPDAIAHLMVGLEYFLEFAQDMKAIDIQKVQELQAQSWEALQSIGEQQTGHQGGQNPVFRFFELLSAAVAAGMGHLGSFSNLMPNNPESAGWRKLSQDTPNFPSHYEPQGTRIGWVDEKNIYLQPDVAYTVYQRIARDMGEALPISSQTLRKRLKEQGVTQVEEGRLTIRKMIEGQRREVLCIPLDPSIQKVHQVHQLYQPSRGSTYISGM
ncbi:hypothetical protein [Nitrospira sp. Ecomares 2.1]